MTTFDNEEMRVYTNIVIDKLIDIKHLKNVDITDDQIIQYHEKYEKAYKRYKECEEEIGGFLSEASEDMEKTQKFYKDCKYLINYLEPLYETVLTYPSITGKFGMVLEAMIKNIPQSDLNKDNVKEAEDVIENYINASAALCVLFERHINIFKEEYNSNKRYYKQYKENHQKWLNTLEANRIEGKRGLDALKVCLKYLKKVEHAECYLRFKQINGDIRLHFTSNIDNDCPEIVMKTKTEEQKGKQR